MRTRMRPTDSAQLRSRPSQQANNQSPTTVTALRKRKHSRLICARCATQLKAPGGHADSIRRYVGHEGLVTFGGMQRQVLSAQVAADLLGFGEPATPTRASADGSIWAGPWAVPAADEQTVLVQTSYGLVPVGWVQSALRLLDDAPNQREGRSEEHTSELQSRRDLVCRLLLEKKKK